MMEAGHKLPVDKGLVGLAAQTKQPVLVSNVQNDPNWLPNPILPDTKCEAAIPIQSGENLLGVLDVQHHIVNGLSQVDVDLLQSIANQVAIGLQNARLYQQAQQRAQRESIINEINQSIQDAATIDEVLRVTTQELNRLMSAQNTGIEIDLKKSA